MTDDRDASFIDAFEPARLVARDPEDLAVVSALLQDAVALSGDLAWLPKQGRFALVANRYRWETPSAEERVRAGAHVDHVRRVRVKGLDPAKKDRPVVLLSLIFEPAAPATTEPSAQEPNAHEPNAHEPNAQEQDGQPHTDPGGVLRIACAPDALTGQPIEIALEVEVLEVALRDLTRPWAAKSRPAHEPGGEPL